MTLEMPSDPFGTPSGLFALLDPPQEIPTVDDAHPPSDPSPGSDFIMDFDLEVLGDGMTRNPRETEPVPVVEVKSSTRPVRPVLRRAPGMPTILEEDEREEEDGDVTITPSEAQRALLPPDTFARPRLESQLAGAADASQDPRSDPLETPRPGGKFRFMVHSGVVTLVTDFRECFYSPAAEMNAFSVPAPDTFDASFSLGTGLDVSRDSQGSLGQFDFSLLANELAVPDFDVCFDADIPAWNEAVFGESPSQGSTSSSPSSWEETYMEELSMETGMMGTDIDMQLQFPTVKVDAIGDGTGMLAEDEFLRAIMEAVQSSPRTVSTSSLSFCPFVL